MRVIEDKFHTIEKTAEVFRLIARRNVEKTANWLMQYWTEGSFTDDVPYTDEEIVAIRTTTLLIRAVLAKSKNEFRAKLTLEMSRLNAGEFWTPEFVATGKHVETLKELFEQFGLVEPEKGS